MCDFSLQSVRSRAAKVGDKLVTCDFGTGTRGFAAADDPELAVCVMPGTELAFTREVACLSAGLLGWKTKTNTIDRQTANLLLCTRIRSSIGTENLIPEEVNYEIAIRVSVMNEVQFLLASEPRKPLKPRSLYVILLVDKDVRVKRDRACEYHHHKKI